MSEEAFYYWSKLDRPPHWAFELKTGVIGYCWSYDRQEISSKNFIRFLAATLIYPSGRVQPYSTYVCPEEQVLKIESFTMEKNQALGNLFAKLRDAFFGRGGRRKNEFSKDTFGRRTSL